MKPLPVTMVNACLRNGRGGSPTGVLPDEPYEPSRTDAERSQVPVRFRTSHAVFVRAGDTVDLRFFTANGELPACGHGTLAALAYLAEQPYLAEQRGGAEHEFRLRVSGRIFTGRTRRVDDQVHAAFDPGQVTLRQPTSAETDAVVAALGIDPDLLAPGARVAALGRERMLVPVATPEAVAALAPDLDRLRAACDRFGLLGCYSHSVPTDTGRVTARMFAPSIGVPEDIANANSTACLAAHLGTDISVDMGDSLGVPATITATTDGSTVLVGGACLARPRLANN